MGRAAGVNLFALLTDTLGFELKFPARISAYLQGSPMPWSAEGIGKERPGQPRGGFGAMLVPSVEPWGHWGGRAV